MRIENYRTICYNVYTKKSGKYHLCDITLSVYGQSTRRYHKKQDIFHKKQYQHKTRKQKSEKPIFPCPVPDLFQNKLRLR